MIELCIFYTLKKVGRKKDNNLKLENIFMCSRSDRMAYCKPNTYILNKAV